MIFANTPGLLRDPDDETTLIGRMTVEEAECLLPEHRRPRAREAARRRRGAPARALAQTCVADGRVARPLFNAMAGAGTWLR